MRQGKRVQLSPIEDVLAVVEVARRGLAVIGAGFVPGGEHVAAFEMLSSIGCCASSDCGRLFFMRDRRAIYCGKRCKSRETVRASRARREALR